MLRMHQCTCNALQNYMQDYTSNCRQTVPFLLQATRQGFQDLGAKDVPAIHELLKNGQMRLECRTGAAQAEGGVHDMHSFDKVRW